MNACTLFARCGTPGVCNSSCYGQCSAGATPSHHQSTRAAQYARRAPRPNGRFAPLDPGTCTQYTGRSKCIRVIFDKNGTCIQNNPYPLPGHRKTGPLSPVTGRAVRETGHSRLCPVSQERLESKYARTVNSLSLIQCTQH